MGQVGGCRDVEKDRDRDREREFHILKLDLRLAEINSESVCCSLEELNDSSDSLKIKLK